MFNEQSIAKGIWDVYSPIILVVGTLGNLITIIVLMQPRNRNSSIPKYLTALAVSDLSVLWVAVPRNWLLFGYGIDLRSTSQLICKIHLYLLNFSVYNSTLFVVILTIERFIYIWLPMKARSICLPRNANIVILCVVTFNAILCAHFLYGMGHPEKNVCYPLHENYAGFYFHIWPKIITALILIPLAVLPTVNISIIIRVLMVHRKIQSQALPQELTTAARARRAKHYRLTAMLITLNVVFIICFVPMLVFLTSHADWILSHGNTHSDAVLEMIWAILNALLYTNNAVNFILYFLSGSDFRNEVTDIVQRRLNSCRAKCQRNVHSHERSVYTVENVEWQN